MRGKRTTAIFLTVLSFFMLFCESACTAKKGNQDDYVLPANMPNMKIYMESEKVEPQGGITEKNIKCTGVSSAEALKLFDNDPNTVPNSETDYTVTLDMGVDIVFSQIRYYVTALTKENKNCFGTRFYASKDNKKFTELSVCEGIDAPQNKWLEADFSGYGNYRYFRAVIPAKANIGEIEWMGTQGFSVTQNSDKTSNVNITVTAYDVTKNFDGRIITAVFNKNNVMKNLSVTEKHFTAGKSEVLNIAVQNTDWQEGDSCRLMIFDDKGKLATKSPLEYRINDAAAKFSVASVFGSNMILQSDKPIIVWGKAPKDRAVTVKLESKLGSVPAQTAKADENSNWEVNLGSLSSGGDYTLTIRCDSEAIVYKNITVGDVWICTGQSNMDYYMMNGDDTAKELESPQKIKNKNIRLMNMWNMGIDGASAVVDNPPVGGTPWREADADTVAYCTAVGYYFARDIQKTTQKPVGIINVAVGDTEINRWIAKGTKNGSFTSTDGNLYNNRIHPLSKLAVKGVILYQGEADQYRTHLSSDEYSDAMAGLINSYRKIWGSDLPFYWTQLTRYKVDESLVREGQRQTLYKVANKKNIGMISLLDIYGRYEGGTGSCREDIHPWDKKTVGERFAAIVKRDCYGSDTPAVGPMFKSATKKGDSIVVAFECTGSLAVMDKSKYADKVTDDKIRSENIDATKLMEFEVAGKDKVFKPAEAVIDGNTVVVKSSQVKSPEYVRYAWGAYPEMPNLTDDTGLPSATFTTEK